MNISDVIAIIAMVVIWFGIMGMLDLYIPPSIHNYLLAIGIGVVILSKTGREYSKST